ncbi:hypothetical protein [Paenibacillus contaminans]|uniref:Uncharacterized protein n=1 Tax=Paenibacillus contaminans TaxID=450362 RepID=A0A329MDD9_9BACL|nr:hypothetical protein [Paenibacillus contaminans]RAV16663.1 hypothetical protein DQG23_27885 [Paenibacillus contaminans]
MKPIDYGVSFITGKWSENQVRLWVESRMRFIDEKSGRVEDYYQCGACKSEATFAEKDLFYEDNFDFIPVFGPEYGIIFNRKAYLNVDTYKQFPKSENMWGGQRYNIREHKQCELLDTNDKIREATHNDLLLIGQTELFNSETGLRAIIEFPIKTMNIHDKRNMYQVDTGPVLLPDLSNRYDKAVDSISLAYVAFNVPHFADFVVEQPTAIFEGGKELCKVYHYSGPISLTASNRLYAVTG